MSQKKKALKITIPEPCSENINQMIPVKGGKFCSSCEKTVVDFRGMTDRQIIRFYEKNKGNLCGMFRPEQLNRAIPFPMVVKPSTNWKAIAALASGLFLSGGLVAQSTTATMGKPMPAIEINVKGESEFQSANKTSPDRIVKGVIVDKELNEPLIGANILIMGTTIGTSTDLDGHFMLKIPNGLEEFELEVSYTGYENQTISFTKKDSRLNEQLKVKLKVGPTIVDKVVVVGLRRSAVIAGGITAIHYEEVEEEQAPEIPPIKFEDREENAAENPFTVHPNPFFEEIKITYNFEESDNYLFHFYDTKGSLIFAKSLRLTKGQQVVELTPPSQNLADGMYILQVSDSQDRILKSKKVFKGQP